VGHWNYCIHDAGSCVVSDLLGFVAEHLLTLSMSFGGLDDFNILKSAEIWQTSICLSSIIFMWMEYAAAPQFTLTCLTLAYANADILSPWYSEPMQKIEKSQEWYEREQARCKRLASAAKRGGEPPKKAAKKGA
jgi:hypothetical protein